MRMEPSSVRKKVKEPPNVTKELSHVILESHNVRKKESKGTTKCEKRIVTCDVGITQYENGTVKCEKKKGNHQMLEKNCHM